MDTQDLLIHRADSVTDIQTVRPDLGIVKRSMVTPMVLSLILLGVLSLKGIDRGVAAGFVFEGNYSPNLGVANSVDQEKKKALPCEVTKAEYFGPPPLPGRSRVRISGRSLKNGCVASDVESKGQDAAGHDTRVERSRSIIMTSGTQCEAVLAHLANFEKTFVRIRCSDGKTFSDWAEVLK